MLISRLDKVYQLRLDTKNPDIDFTAVYVILKQISLRHYLLSVTALKVKKRGLNKILMLPTFMTKTTALPLPTKSVTTYNKFLKGLEPWERKTLDRALEEDKNYYVMEFSNLGGLVMPILLELTYEDGTKEERYIPAEIWRRNHKNVQKLIVTDKNKPLVPQLRLIQAGKQRMLMLKITTTLVVLFLRVLKCLNRKRVRLK